MVQLFKNNSEFYNPMLVNPDQSTVEFIYPEGYFTVTLIVHSALDPLSNKRLELFSRFLEQFQSVNCCVVGVTRDSTAVLQDFMSMTRAVNFPLVSYINIGIAQSLEAALFDCYPDPTTVILDRNGMVRYTETTDPEMEDGYVEEILGMVRALKIVDSIKEMTVIVGMYSK